MHMTIALIVVRECLHVKRDSPCCVTYMQSSRRKGIVISTNCGDVLMDGIFPPLTSRVSIFNYASHCPELSVQPCVHNCL